MRRYDLAAAIICVAMTVLALVIGHFHEVGAFGVETDFYGAYAIQATNIMEGRPYTYQHNPPGYVLLLAAVSSATGDLFVAGKLISAVASGLFGGLTYLLFKALFGSPIALAVMMLSLVALIPHSFLAATDVVGATLVILALWVFLGRPVRTLSRCFLTGLLAGAAYLVRANAIFVLVGVGFSLIAINLDQESVRKRLVKAVFFGVGALLLLGPWLLVNWQTNGTPFASTAYLQVAAHFYHPLSDTVGTTLGQMASEFSSFWDVLVRDPAMVAARWAKDVLFWNPMRLSTEVLRFPAYLFAGAGLLRVLNDLAPQRRAYLLVCVLGYLLLGLVGFGVRYYLHPRGPRFL